MCWQVPRLGGTAQEQVTSGHAHADIVAKTADDTGTAEGTLGVHMAINSTTAHNTSTLLKVLCLMSPFMHLFFANENVCEYYCSQTF